MVKMEVIELDPGTTYMVNGTESDGSTLFGIGNDQTVVTEKFRMDANDIVTNDIVHVAVFDDPNNYEPKEYGKPALGALVMGKFIVMSSVPLRIS